MAYFKCTKVSGGLKLIVTCDANFAGSTITCTDGTHTYQKTCPSSSPYEVEYEGLVAGTYTISGVAQGVTHSTTVVMSDVTESLYAFPDGSTVLPTDDIQTLLHCANIWDKAYTTLADLLADSTSLLAVTSSNNAVDYLVRSKTFASAQGLVPVMTSNNTPSGVVSADSFYTTGYEPWRAFSKSTSPSDCWHSTNATADHWIRYQFPNAVCVRRVYILDRVGGTAGSVSPILRGSNDGTNWTPIDTLEYTATSTGESHEFNINNNNSYTYYELYYPTSPSNYIQIQQLQFYATVQTTGFCDNSTAMTDIGANNYCANTLLADSTWLNAICNSTYFESVLNVKVPTMTSNTTPSGECFGSTPQDGQWYRVFDGDNAQYLQFSNASGENVGYKFPTSMRALKAKIYCMAGYVSSTCSLQASNDGSTWVTLISNLPTPTTPTIYSITNANSYTRYRIVFNASSNYNCIYELQFYGV